MTYLISVGIYTVREASLEIVPDIILAEKVKIRFCLAQHSICWTIFCMEDFYCHKKCLAIKCVCPAVIPAKTTFVCQINQSCCIDLSAENIVN